MTFTLDKHYSFCLILPNLAVGEIRDDKTEESQGIAITFGWLFWDIEILFQIEE